MSAPIAQGISHMFNQVRDGAKGLLPLFILLLYTVFGALLFRELEGPNEKYMLETLRKERDVLLENTVFRLNNIRAMQPVAAYNHTVKTLLKYQDRLGVEQVNPEETRWNFWGAIFYCMTVYTTIGYGNIVPVTTAGRVLTILYAFAGIPLAVICLFSLGAIFARLCKILWKYMLKSTAVVSKDLEKKVNAAVGFDEARQMETSKLVEQSADDDDDLLSFPISFLVFLTILWVFICAGIFLLFEDWDYGTSLYFTLISFTTIGFGDILPSEYDYIVVVGVLLLIGLSLVSTVLTLIQQQIEALATGMQANIDREYMNALAEAADEGEISEQDVKRMSAGNIYTVEKGKSSSKPQEVDPRSLDAVISRMPLKERFLYHVMPSGSKKLLQEQSAKKQNRRNKSCQTDISLLEGLLKEEILKMELNNELDKHRPNKITVPTPSPRLVSSDVKTEKVVPVEVSSTLNDEPVITTTMIKEDEV